MPVASSDGARSLVSRSSPTGGSNAVKLLYLLSIAAARRTLDIQTPYFVLDESTEWALREARSRGVRVRLLLEGDRTDAKSVKDASRNDYQQLLDAGVEIHEFLPTMMHVKAMVVDGVWSLVGSANFDNRSFELNDELIVAVADRSLAERLLEGDFEADLARSPTNRAGPLAAPLVGRAGARAVLGHVLGIVLVAASGLPRVRTGRRRSGATLAGPCPVDEQTGRSE